MTTPEVAAELAKAETKATGVGPLEGGTAGKYAQKKLWKQSELIVMIQLLPRVFSISRRTSPLKSTKSPTRHLKNLPRRMLANCSLER